MCKSTRAIQIGKYWRAIRLVVGVIESYVYFRGREPAAKIFFLLLIKELEQWLLTNNLDQKVGPRSESDL